MESESVCLPALGRRNFVKTVGSLVAVAALPVSFAGATGAHASGTDASGLEGALAGITDQAIQARACPGIQICVWRDNAPLVSLARGFANLETSTPVSAATVFRAGSLTKQFTAALIAKLQEQGKLSVHDGLDRYLEFFAGKHPPTLLELIHHTAGVHAATESVFDPRPVTQVELARRIAAQDTLFDFPPGTAWLYSNVNYILLGAVIEVVTGQPLAAAARHLLFGPLGLADTAFDANADVVPNRGNGYTPTAAGAVAFANADCLPVEQAGGAGAIRSTATDLCRWHQALFSGRLVTQATLDRMLAPARLRDGRPAIEHRFDPADANMGATSYGYGLLLDRATRDGGVIALHNGFISGFSAWLATHVPSRLTVACLCNADPSPGLPFRALRRTVFAQQLR